MKFTATHEWVEIANKIATVGISKFASEELGDLVYVQLPQVGDKVTAGEAFAEVESVKAVSPVLSPVTGTIVEINEELIDKPELINEDAYKAWFIKVEVLKEGELISKEEYEKLISK